MIDWVTVSIPYPHSTPINGGNVVSILPTGEEDWRIEKRLQVRGSFDSSIQIKSEHKNGWCSNITLDGNPAKWLQGHNVWGSGDLAGLIIACFERILPSVLPPTELKPLDLLVTFVHCGRLTRLDITYMYDLGNSQRVLTWIRAAANSADLSHRGKGDFSGDTLYWGKRSRRWALKMYSKGLELKVHRPKNKNCEKPDWLPSVTNYADGALRVELVLRSMELDKMGLSTVMQWSEELLDEVYDSYLSGLKFSENMTISSEISNIEKLPSRLRACALAWSEGHDLRTLYPRATWYRYKNEIFKIIGLDISLAPPKQRPETSNVVPLVIVLEAKQMQMQVPEWAKGTPLYFEPPAYQNRVVPLLRLVK